jgi:hypothetical protein
MDTYSRALIKSIERDAYKTTDPITLADEFATTTITLQDGRTLLVEGDGTVRVRYPHGDFNPAFNAVIILPTLEHKTSVFE